MTATPRNPARPSAAAGGLPSQSRAGSANHIISLLRQGLCSDLGLLIILGLTVFVIHMLTNGQYGFHRDELAFIAEGQHLDWGFVEYPPLTPFVGQVALAAFGPSLVGFRFFSALGMSAVLVLVGLIAHELGGSRWTQITAALAAAVSPYILGLGALFNYEALDCLWWVLTAYLVIRLLHSDNPRWWLAIGAVIGLGMMTRYTMAFWAAGLVVGVLLTPARRYLKSPWLWAGAILSLLIVAPNLVWQAQHNFITLLYLSSIHARDIGAGRTASFLLDQLYLCANPATIPLWMMGLYFFWRVPDGRPYRSLGWMYVVVLAVLVVSQGRGYYLAPVYPMLLAAGCCQVERGFARLTNAQVATRRRLVYGGLTVGGLIMAAVALPVAPVNSAW